MKPIHLALLAGFVACLAACQSGAPRTFDEATRAELLGTVKALEGRWEGKDPEGNLQAVEFRVSSGGSAVREIMFPGTPDEMTNMYHLDGDTLVLTHYCAAGNQPRMRAARIDAGRLEFQFESVTDRESADQVYMGRMTLVVEDQDHIREDWQALRGDELDHATSFHLTRVR